MSKLTDEQILGAIKSCPPVKHDYAGWVRDLRLLWGRAIESAATEPLLQRIAELEKALKLVQQHHATAWNRGHIAGMAANRMVAQDALNAVKKDAWNNTQLTEALMAAEGRCEELEQRNRDLYEDVQRFKEHALNEKAARLELERQLEEARSVLKETGRLLHHFWCDVQMNDYSFEKLNKGMEAIDAAMQKGQS